MNIWRNVVSISNIDSILAKIFLLPILMNPDAAKILHLLLQIIFTIKFYIVLRALDIFFMAYGNFSQHFFTLS